MSSVKEAELGGGGWGGFGVGPSITGAEAANIVKNSTMAKLWWLTRSTV